VDPVFTGMGRGRACGRRTRWRLGEGAASTGHAELRRREDRRRLREGAVDPTTGGSDPAPVTGEGRGGGR
jgi:hypothetical protein